ncbi:MAG TPA: hypothetical protein VJR89_28225 [Polyangiales bacterium]|nr:hypothetical protein [Polyangiales bacterium]
MTEASNSPELERALAAARGALGSPEQVARLRERVALGLATGASGVVLSRTLRAKLSGFTVAGVLAVGSGWLWLQAAGAPPSQAGAAQAIVHSAAPQVLQPETLPVQSTAPQAPEAKAPAPAARARTSSSRHVVSSPPQAAVPVSEVELISRAEALVDRSPAAALELLGTHERLYPQGMLGEERDVLRVDAEWALGQRARALGHARAFLQRYPSSAQTRRLSRLLADHNSSASATPTE